ALLLLSLGGVSACDSDSGAACQTPRPGSTEDLSRQLDDAERALAEARKEAAGLSAAQGKLGGGPGTLDLDMEFVLGDTPRELETSYDLESGTVKFDSVRYWLSNVTLVGATGETVIPNSYYLMEVRKKFVKMDDNDQPIYELRRRETVSIPGVPAGLYSGL